MNMVKVVEWKRLNESARIWERHFMNADNHNTNFSVTVDGVTYRVRNVPEVGHMFVEV